MKKLTHVFFVSFYLLSTVSCIDEKLNACPPEGGSVEIALKVERFQSRPPYLPSDFEQEFGERIHSIDYLLYAGNELVGQGRLENLQAAAGSDFLFYRDTLPFGSYRMVVAANTTSAVMSGTANAPESYYIVYQDDPEGDDFFRTDLLFEVTCPCRNVFETVLHRVHGVTRFKFENVPAAVSHIEITLDNVGERTPLSGEPDRPYEVTRRFAVAEALSRASASHTLGTFCTLPDARSSCRIRLYGDNSMPLYDRVVTDTLRIECNQLTELTARFKGADFRNEIEFSVNVDTVWDGSNEGGDVIVR